MSRLSIKDRMAFYRLMAQYAQDGQSTIQLLRKKAVRAKKNKTKNGDIFISIANRIDRDNLSLADAMRPHIIDEEYIYIKTAESKTGVAEMLLSLSVMVEKKAEMNALVQKAVMKPVVSIILSLALLGVALYLLVPTIIDLVGEKQLHGFDYFILSVFTPYASIYFPILAVMLVFITAMLIITMPTLVAMPWRGLLDLISPLHRVYREYVASLILVSLGASLQAGMTAKDFFKLNSKQASPYMKRICLKILNRFSVDNLAVANSMDIGIFHRDDMDQIHDYMQAKNSNDALIKIGREALKTSTVRIEKAASQIFWGILGSVLLFVSLYIGFTMNIASSVLSPDTSNFYN
jgi:type II secretory pathway component PulF